MSEQNFHDEIRARLVSAGKTEQEAVDLTITAGKTLIRELMSAGASELEARRIAKRLGASVADPDERVRRKAIHDDFWRTEPLEFLGQAENKTVEVRVEGYDPPTITDASTPVARDRFLGDHPEHDPQTFYPQKISIESNVFATQPIDYTGCIVNRYVVPPQYWDAKRPEGAGASHPLVRLILSHVLANEVLETGESAYNHVLDLLAYQYRYEHSPALMAMVSGAHRTGKDFFFCEILSELFGVRTKSPQTQSLVGKFQGNLVEGTRVLYFSEIENAGRGFYKELKRLIGSTITRAADKNVQEHDIKLQMLIVGSTNNAIGFDTSRADVRCSLFKYQGTSLAEVLGAAGYEPENEPQLFALIKGQLWSFAQEIQEHARALTTNALRTPFQNETHRAVCRTSGTVSSRLFDEILEDPDGTGLESLIESTEPGYHVSSGMYPELEQLAYKEAVKAIVMTVIWSQEPRSRAGGAWIPLKHLLAIYRVQTPSGHYHTAQQLGRALRAQNASALAVNPRDQHTSRDSDGKVYQAKNVFLTRLTADYENEEQRSLILSFIGPSTRAPLRW